MHDALLVGVRHRLGHRARQAHRRLDVQPLPAGAQLVEPGAQADAVDQLHREEDVVAVGHHLVDAHDAGVVERIAELRLALQPRAPRGVSRVAQALQRHAPLGGGVERLEHHPHAALGEAPLDAVAADGPALGNLRHAPNLSPGRARTCGPRAHTPFPAHACPGRRRHGGCLSRARSRRSSGTEEEMVCGRLGVLIACVGALALASGCNDDGGAKDGGTDGGADGGFAFQPSNFSLDGHDLSQLKDVDVTSDCTITSDSNVSSYLCAGEAVDWIATQSDGSKLHVFAVKSLTLESNAKLKVTGPFAAALVTLGDLTLNGQVDAAAHGYQAGPGGYGQSASFTAGSGPGGGPAGVADGMGPPPGIGYLAGISGGGGSYCGQGGTGTQEGDTAGPLTVSPAPATAAYGTADLRPLLAGSSGGVGGLGAAGSGGGALQLVAGGAFKLGPFGVINVGGGGGENAGLTNGQQEASGGGAGGAVLIEATTADVSGVIAANGGGGGGKSTSGSDGTPDGNPAAGGSFNGAPLGGAGGAGAHPDGVAGTQASSSEAGAGGGGAGRVRLNTASGAASLSGTLSPAATTSCATQGKLRALGTGT